MAYRIRTSLDAIHPHDLEDFGECCPASASVRADTFDGEITGSIDGSSHLPTPNTHQNGLSDIVLEPYEGYLEPQTSTRIVVRHTPTHAGEYEFDLVVDVISVGPHIQSIPFRSMSVTPKVR